MLIPFHIPKFSSCNYEKSIEQSIFQNYRSSQDEFNKLMILRRNASRIADDIHQLRGLYVLRGQLLLDLEANIGDLIEQRLNGQKTDEQNLICYNQFTDIENLLREMKCESKSMSLLFIVGNGVLSWLAASGVFILLFALSAGAAGLLSIGLGVLATLAILFATLLCVGLLFFSSYSICVDIKNLLDLQLDELGLSMRDVVKSEPFIATESGSKGEGGNLGNLDDNGQLTDADQSPDSQSFSNF